MRRLIAVAGLVLAIGAAAPAMDIDLRLIGYSFLPVAAAHRVADGLELELRDGSRRTVDLRYGWLVGTDGAIDRPRVLHQHWIRISHDGARASLVTTTAPLLGVAAVCLALDLLLLGRHLRRRRARRGSDRDAPSPTPAARGSADSAPPRP